MSESSVPSSDWHLDRKVTLALIVTILGNVAMTAWWASTITASVSELRTTDARYEVLIQALNAGREGNASRITALETNYSQTNAKLVRIEDKIDRLIERYTNDRKP